MNDEKIIPFDAEEFTPEETRTLRQRIQEYLKTGGPFCPFCLDGSVEASMYESDDEGGSQWVKCNECGAEWKDQFGLSNITDGNGDPIVPEESAPTREDLQALLIEAAKVIREYRSGEELAGQEPNPIEAKIAQAVKSAQVRENLQFSSMRLVKSQSAL